MAMASSNGQKKQHLSVPFSMANKVCRQRGAECAVSWTRDSGTPQSSDWERAEDQEACIQGWDQGIILLFADFLKQEEGRKEIGDWAGQW